jgi:hypothetical protein
MPPLRKRVSGSTSASNQAAGLVIDVHPPDKRRDRLWAALAAS